MNVRNTLRPVVRSVRGAARWLRFRAIREVEVRLGSKRQVPSVGSDGRVRIHLGCGSVDAPGFFNVDAKPAPHVHHVGDVTNLSFLPSGHADLVYACHVLEHSVPKRHREVLWEWARVLKPGGVLRLSVPDFDKLIAAYVSEGRDVNAVALPLVGGDVGYGAHQWLFNFTYLANLLSEVGLVDAREWDPATVAEHDFEDWASRPIRRGDRAYPISLNIEATKP